MVILKRQQVNMKKSTTDSFTSPQEHQKDRMQRMFVTPEMLPIYRVLEDILDELKKLNSK